MHFTSKEQTSQYKKDRDALTAGERQENPAGAGLDGLWRSLPTPL